MKVTADKATNVVIQGAVIFVCGMTAAMNFRYGFSTGANDVEKYMLAGTGLAFDVVKFLGLTYAVMAWRKKARVKAVLAGLGWFLCLAYSMNAALGFATMTRSHMVAETQFNIKKDSKAQTEVDEVTKKARAKYQEKFNTLTAKNAEIEDMKKNQRYESTAACSVSEKQMTTESVYFCRRYYWAMTDVKNLKIDVEVAEKEMETKISNLPKVEEKFHADPDPLMTFYSKLFGKDVETLITIWAVAVAVVMELVASVGNFAFSPTRLKPVYRQKEEEVSVPEKIEEVEAPVKRRPGRPLGSKNKPKLHVVA